MKPVFFETNRFLWVVPLIQKFYDRDIGRRVIIIYLWYTKSVHKPFYASGFFYHCASQQILLQQQTHGDDIKFTLFRGKSHNGADPQLVFRQCIEEALGESIAASSIRPVYDYIHDTFGMHFIFYVEVTGIIPRKLKDRQETKWISLSKLTKLNMSEQTRHDIIVGERVIRASLEQKNTTSSAKGWH